MIYCVVVIARQFEGDLISLKFEGAFHNKTDAEAFVKGQPKTFSEMINGTNVEFFCERGIHEVELK